MNGFGNFGFRIPNPRAFSKSVGSDSQSVPLDLVCSSRQGVLKHCDGGHKSDSGPHLYCTNDRMLCLSFHIGLYVILIILLNSLNDDDF